jgi:hypothetical protein
VFGILVIREYLVPDEFGVRTDIENGARAVHDAELQLQLQAGPILAPLGII